MGKGVNTHTHLSRWKVWIGEFWGIWHDAAVHESEIGFLLNELMATFKRFETIINK